MFASVILTLCLASGECTDVTVTDKASMLECMFGVQQAGAQWMQDEGWTARGYRLARWRCEMGKRGTV